MADLTVPAFEVTAAKYRPKVFDELAGQEFVVSTLKNSLQSGHIAHAYLFSGPRGCGKTSAARILARALNCSGGGKDGNPCGVCDNCKSIGQGANIDVLEIDGATNKSIDDIRQIKDEVLFPPQSGRYKVYIIDEVHMLSIQAFNALLKTIEEPPPYIVFIFATTELHKVPATIKSRCQQFNFRLISIDIIQDILKKICAQAGIQAEDDALFWIARESTGSMRDAFTLFDQVVSFSAGNIRSDLIREKLGIIGLEKLNALAQACAENDAPGAFALTDEIIESGASIEQFIIDMAGYYRSLLLLKNGVTRESILGFPVSSFSVKVLEAYDSIRIEQAMDILLGCYRDIRYSLSPRYELETAVSKLSWLNRWISPAELKEAVDSAQNALGQTVGVIAGKANASGKPNLPYSAQPQARPASSSQPPKANEAGNSSPAQFPGGGRSLSEDLQRVIASKENSQDDEDVPLWDSAVHQKDAEKEVPPEVERVLSMIPGTVVS